MSSDQARLHAALVDHLLALGVLTQPSVVSAFRAVPRHLFLPTLPIEAVYRDEAIPTKMENGRAISASSQPTIMAIMLEQLNVRPGQRVLEIGAGTGYNAALLGHLVGPSGQVVTVDIDEDLVAAARGHLAAANSSNVQVVRGDGGDGYAPGAPYDRIILTVGAWDIPPAWYDQLSPGGTLVLPLEVATIPQKSIAFEKAPPGAEPRLVSRSAVDCGFMALRGEFAGPEVITVIGTDPSLTIATPGAMPVEAERVYQWLLAPAEPRGTGLQTTEAELFGSLALWLDLHTDNLSALTIEGLPAPGSRWPCLFQWDGSQPRCSTYQLITHEGLAVLDGPDRSAMDPSQSGSELGAFELKVSEYGPQGRQVAQDLLALLAAWNNAGRPPNSRLRLRVYGPEYPYTLAPGEVRVPKRWTQTVVDWPAEPAAKA